MANKVCTKHPQHPNILHTILLSTVLQSFRSNRI